MLKQASLLALILLVTFSVSAQSLLKGTVLENGTNKKLQDVFVRDIANKQFTLTDKQGNFEIKAETGQTLIFESPGYTSDTLYLVDLARKNILMSIKTIALREVSVTSNREAFDPHKEYPEVYEKSKVYVLSPTTWFSKESTDARKLKKYFKHEAEERHVDEVFTEAYVGSIVPLKGKELDDFMTLYRPSYAFLMNNNGASLAVYINDCYKKFQALPPDKRSLPKLTGQLPHD
ncbi:MAG TPA: carboxypeptidase-like regulatory domain-containing protein [Mucilaginibacter sp.]|jgi:hypothetical protein